MENDTLCKRHPNKISYWLHDIGTLLHRNLSTTHLSDPELFQIYLFQNTITGTWKKKTRINTESQHTASDAIRTQKRLKKKKVFRWQDFPEYAV